MDHSASAPPPDAGPLFDVELALGATVAVVTLRGELDIASAGRLHAALETVAGSDVAVVRIDLGELRFIDAAGIGELVQLHVELAAAGRRLSLDRARPRLLRTFRLAEADWLVG
ncbi:MAG: hypothetical protein QOI15_2148 [Pseudonocardiales bacterium]|nr:hypothetical protein [Pseudonocardiales bacterium]